jgi:hypothetical protein
MFWGRSRAALATACSALSTCCAAHYHCTSSSLRHPGTALRPTGLRTKYLQATARQCTPLAGSARRDGEVAARGRWGVRSTKNKSLSNGRIINSRLSVFSELPNLIKSKLAILSILLAATFLSQAQASSLCSS